MARTNEAQPSTSAPRKADPERRVSMATVHRDTYSEAMYTIADHLGRTPLKSIDPSQTLSNQIAKELLSSDGASGIGPALDKFSTEFSGACTRILFSSSFDGFRQTAREIRRDMALDAFAHDENGRRPLRAQVYSHFQDTLEFGFGAALQLANQTVYGADPGRLPRVADLSRVVRALQNPAFQASAEEFGRTGFNVLRVSFGHQRTAESEGDPGWRRRIGLTQDQSLYQTSTAAGDAEGSFALDPAAQKGLIEQLAKYNRIPEDKPGASRAEYIGSGSGCPVRMPPASERQKGQDGRPSGIATASQLLGHALHEVHQAVRRSPERSSLD